MREVLIWMEAFFCSVAAPFNLCFAVNEMSGGSAFWVAIGLFNYVVFGGRAVYFIFGFDKPRAVQS
jgi:hypothetical protein